jgi:anti-anti-sigma factor
MRFGFAASEVSGIPLVVFEGDVDGETVSSFETAIVDAARDADNCVLVDLQGVTYIDSQAFGRLLKTHISLEREGGDLAIVAGHGDVARIVRTMGADCLLGVFDAEDSAAAYLLPLLTPDGSA